MRQILIVLSMLYVADAMIYDGRYRNVTFEAMKTQGYAFSSSIELWIKETLL
jgi:hypothetical protein